MVGMVGVGGLSTNFQFLMLSPNLLRSQIPCMEGGGEVGDQLPTFDDESKSAKIQNSQYGVKFHNQSPKPNFLFQEGKGGGVMTEATIIGSSVNYCAPGGSELICICVQLI